MNLKKMTILFSSLISPLITIPTIVSCSNNSTNNKIDKLKITLDNFVDNNRNELNSNCVKSSFNNSLTSNINLFTILTNPSIISTYFDFSRNFELSENLKLNFEFTYGIIDSYGNSLNPFISSDKSSITIPVLIYLYNSEQDIQICKYINLFSLNIVDSIIEDKMSDYNGVNAKKIIFKNNSQLSEFKSIPTIMVEKYLDFIVLTTNSIAWHKEPIYNNNEENNNFNEWKGKTLTEVRGISQAIKPPSDFFDGKGNKYNYTISKAYFYAEERQYAMFIIKMTLNSSSFSSLIKDAKEIYGLNFEKEYSILVTKFKFAYPSTADIETYISNNKEILAPILAEAKNNIMLFAPIVRIDHYIAKEIGVKKLIERFNNGARDFVKPNSFVYKTDNGQERLISFSIKSLESDETDSNLLKINLEIHIDKGDLMAVDSFSKIFNLKTGKFQ